MANVFPLSPVENVMRLLHDHHDGDATTAAVARVSGWIEEAPLRAALARVQERHPRLRARIEPGRGRQASFRLVEPLASIPLEVREVEDMAAWQQMAVDICREKTDSTGQTLCRVVLLRNGREQVCDLVVRFHHAIADAASMVRFFDDLLTAYAATVTGQPADLPPLPWAEVVMPRVYFPPRRRLWLLLKFLGSLVRDAFLKPWMLNRGRQDCSKRVRRLVLSAKETAALVAACRKEGTTVYGGLAAAALFAARALAGSESLRASCMIPFNLRKVLDPAIGDEQIGCFVGSLKGDFVLGRDVSFWDLARRCRARLNTFVERDGPRLFLKVMDQLQHRTMRLWRNRCSLSVNSLGVVNTGDRHGDLAWTEFSWAPKAVVIGAPLQIMAATLGERLNVTVVGDFVDDAQADTYCRLIESELRRAGAALLVPARPVGEASI